ncbi:hypothetical protein ACVW16_001252 [Bradyrhizobium sp. USDA 4474]
MRMPSRFKTPSHPLSTRIKLQALLADLHWKVHLLSSDIVAEEQRTHISNLSDRAYSILARNHRSRRDNLMATIAVLEKQLVVAEQP